MTEREKNVADILFREFGLKDLEVDAPIFSTKVLDSMDVLKLIMSLEREMGISVPMFEVSLDMFDSIRDIADLTERFS